MKTAAARFGNDPAKIGRYRAFWGRDSVKRPLVGFSLTGWFPVREFAACGAWASAEYLTPEMIAPEAFLPDHIRMLAEGEAIADDLIRGACPGQGAIPWLPGMTGCRLRILPENVLAEDQPLSWNEALHVRVDPGNPWFQKYVDCAEALVQSADGAFPVSHAPELGPTDLHAALRGHTQSILDLADEPERSADLLWRLGTVFQAVTEELWRRLPLFAGGYFDAQYSLWAPGPIVRLQEDATANYSPGLYRKLVQPVDRMLAGRFANSFVHLHSTSMHVLDAFLEIEEIRCFQVNNDVGGPPLDKMIGCFQGIQRAGKPLLIRGSFTADQIRFLVDSLESRGLFLFVMVDSLGEVEQLRPVLGM